MDDPYTLLNTRYNYDLETLLESSEINFLTQTLNFKTDNTESDSNPNRIRMIKPSL